MRVVHDEKYRPPNPVARLLTMGNRSHLTSFPAGESAESHGDQDASLNVDDLETHIAERNRLSHGALSAEPSGAAIGTAILMGGTASTMRQVSETEATATVNASEPCSAPLLAKGSTSGS
jgi:poly(3-hydroxybutyrate) depolymerase